jgi:pilus assembly protein Flp/PilA
MSASETIAGWRRTAGRFAGDTKGTTAIEYGLIAMIVAVAIFASIANMGTTLTSVFGKVTAGFANAS